MTSVVVRSSCLTFVSCCLSVFLVEFIVKIDPGAGNLMTFLSFLLVAIYGFIFTSKCFTVRRKISLRDYFQLVLLFMVSNVANNQAYGFNISVILHSIFRSGSLITNLLLGVLILKKKYSVYKYVSVIMITCGIVICTLASMKPDRNSTDASSCCSDNTVASDYNVFDNSQNDNLNDYYLRWYFGIALMTFALFSSSLTGIAQQKLCEKYGKNPKETLFYTHLLALPVFVLWFPDLKTHIEIASHSPSITFIGISLPILYCLLLANAFVQIFCVKSVYVLASECSSLTVTLVITLRKFISLIISIVYFKNDFTKWHVLATFLVFFGTFIFMDLPQTIITKYSAKKRQ